MEVAIYNTTGKSTSKKVTLSKEVFDIEPNDHAIYMAVKQFLAQQRQGTHKAKERAEIKGSTRKIKKQKGTGTARAGSIKNPLFRGGGRVFGPRPKSYDFKLNKKLKVLARKSALTYKAKAEEITILDSFTIETPKSQAYASILSNLKYDNVNTLIVLGTTDKNVYLSSRNVPNTKVTTAAQLNTYEILRAKRIIMTQDALEVIDNTLNSK